MKESMLIFVLFEALHSAFWLLKFVLGFAMSMTSSRIPHAILLVHTQPLQLYSIVSLMHLVTKLIATFNFQTRPAKPLHHQPRNLVVILPYYLAWQTQHEQAKVDIFLLGSLFIIESAYFNYYLKILYHTSTNRWTVSRFEL